MTPVSAIAQKHAKQIFAQSHIPESLDEAKLAAMLIQAIEEATSSLRAQLEEFLLLATNLFEATVGNGPHHARPYSLHEVLAAIESGIRLEKSRRERLLEKLKGAERERDVALARQERLITACENSIRALKPFIVAAEDWAETQKRMQVTAPLAQVLHELETQQAPESPLNGKEGK